MGHITTIGMISSTVLSIIFQTDTLSLSQIERAFTAYLATGAFVAPPDFSHENYWRELEVYIRQIERLGSTSWTEILQTARGTEENKKTHPVATSSTISNFRQNLYIPSSPEKPY
jgi:hypothetical protein